MKIYNEVDGRKRQKYFDFSPKDAFYVLYFDDAEDSYDYGIARDGAQTSHERHGVGLRLT